MSEAMGFADCPFCGGSSERFFINTFKSCGDYCEVAHLTCKCGVSMRAEAENEHFELLEGSIYKRIPPRSALDVLRERWNRRVPLAPSVAFGDSSLPEGAGG